MKKAPSDNRTPENVPGVMAPEEDLSLEQAEYWKKCPRCGCTGIQIVLHDPFCPVCEDFTYNLRQSRAPFEGNRSPEGEGLPEQRHGF